MLQELIGRVRRLLLTPGAEWDAIDKEDVDPQRLITHYVAPLAAIGAVATLIGASIVGTTVLGSTFRAPFGAMLANSIVTWAFAIASVFGFAFIINILANTFAAEQNFKQALKVAAYAPTAAWVAAIFAIIPALGILWLVGGLYTLYLLFVGLPKLMKPPKDRAIPYTLVSIVLWIIVALIAGVFVRGLAAPPTPADLFADAGRSAPARVTAPADPNTPVAPFDIQPEELERAAEAGDIGGILSALSGGDASGAIVEPDALRGLAPERLAGLPRQSVEVESLTFPVNAVVMTADYGENDRQLTLTITNSTAISAIMNLSGLTGTEYDRRSDDGYERLERAGDGMIMEEWSESAESGRYARSFASAFLVDAQGSGVSMNDLRRATERFSESDLTTLPTRE